MSGWSKLNPLFARLRLARQLWLEARAVWCALTAPAERTRPPHEPVVPARQAKHEHDAHMHELADAGRRDAMRPPPLKGASRGN